MPKKITQEKIPRNPVACAREVLNYSSIERSDRFDKKTFDPVKFIEKVHIASPSMEVLLKKIEKLDTEDNINHRKLFKHYIFSDLKKGYGAKILASGFVAAGYTPVIKAKGTRIVLDEDVLASKNESKFAVLSSTSIYGAVTSPNSTKEILAAYNKRPENVYGKDVRFIILDSGYTEGVDLFDVKYVHIFEEQNNLANLTQAIGRGTRFCGQSGLQFKGGWELQVFNYKSIAPKGGILNRVANFVLMKKQKGILKKLQERDAELKKKLILEKKLLELIKDNAVDKLLNKNINSTSEIGFFKKHQQELMIGAGAIAGAAALGAGTYIYKVKQKKKPIII